MVFLTSLRRNFSQEKTRNYLRRGFFGQFPEEENEKVDKMAKKYDIQPGEAGRTGKFLTERRSREVRKQPGPAESARLDRGSHMHLRRCLFRANLTCG